MNKNSNKPIIMIHEVSDWMLEIDLSKYIITFDDGLYSQYKNLDHFLSFDTEKYFFISTNIVSPKNERQEKEVIPCHIAHQNFFNNGDTSAYMNWEQIRTIDKSANCFIGGHSHSHRDLRGDIKLKELHDHLTQDTELMLKRFKVEGIKINSFCFPYNYEAPLYKEILKQNDINHFFGNERIAIEDIRREHQKS
ncbi:polysaccharide deacetylase [Halobacteriovorax sp. BALOs_7]|uniref:polysaccharide deacetylase family protein n=1 Tax=unclassified Halobacteriovorax TaxID=2639665 RepID=UPI000EA09A33|nr:polysaccharide deacetylase family protein [Halobacteriovorax sp. BALOs_7]AYF45775.1 polysaccharide deacetylase [Halobacteriovorax sp. BALOs_7]